MRDRRPERRRGQARFADGVVEHADDAGPSGPRSATARGGSRAIAPSMVVLPVARTGRRCGVSLSSAPNVTTVQHPVWCATSSTVCAQAAPVRFGSGPDRVMRSAVPGVGAPRNSSVGQVTPRSARRRRAPPSAGSPGSRMLVGVDRRRALGVVALTEPADRTIRRRVARVVPPGEGGDEDRVAQVGPRLPFRARAPPSPGDRKDVREVG